MRATEFLSDARRNPEQNPKVSVNQAIKNYLDNTKDKIPDSDYKNLFVSFTMVPKLGVNPQSTYNTPIGIYAYPADYVRGLTGDEGPMTNVPFAGDAPYVNIFKSNGYILVIDKLREDNLLMSLYEDLRRVMSPFEKGEMRGGYMHYEDFVDTFIKDEAYSNAKVDSSGGHFWYVTMRCAEVISKRKGIAKPLAWNWLFRQMGIDGVLDTGEGEGIIHENEPIQAVFFNKENVEVLDRVANKYSPERISMKRFQGMQNKEEFEKDMAQLRPILKSGKFDDLIEWLDYGANSKYLPYVPKDLRLQVLSSRPFYIGRLKNPTKQELFSALSVSPSIMLDYGTRLKELLTVNDIVSILRAYNDYLDKNDLRNRAYNAFRVNQIGYLISDVGSEGKRIDFITELLRLNLSAWQDIQDAYVDINKESLDKYYRLVYDIAKQQGNKRIMNDIWMYIYRDQTT